MGELTGRVAIVTGSGRGLGRQHALLLAREGALVVVNDRGGSTTGEGADPGPAEDVVAEIRASGGEAVANGDDVATSDGAQRLIDTALDAYGDVHVLVNNAGILRDRSLVNTIGRGMGRRDHRAPAGPFLSDEGGGQALA